MAIKKCPPPRNRMPAELLKQLVCCSPARRSGWQRSRALAFWAPAARYLRAVEASKSPMLYSWHDREGSADEDLHSSC
jgi:hypothetical protein